MGSDERADRLDLLLGDAPLEPSKTTAPDDLLLELGGVEVEHLGDARRRILGDHRTLGDRLPAEHLDRVHRDARHLDAHRERGAVAIVHAAALGDDVESALTLLLGHLAPLGAVFHLDADKRRRR